MPRASPRGRADFAATTDRVRQQAAADGITVGLHQAAAACPSPAVAELLTAVADRGRTHAPQTVDGSGAK